MSIRARLTIGVLVLLVTVIAAMGVAMARATESTLIDQSDIDVKQQSKHLTDPLDEKSKNDQGGQNDQGLPTDDDENRLDNGTPVTGGSTGGRSSDESQYGGEQQVASFVFNSNGDLKFSKPSGYADDPDSPPALPEFGSEEFNALIGHIVTLPSVDGTLDYRVLIQPGRVEGDFAVAAAPLDDVRASVQRMINQFLWIGAASLLLAALAVWWVIRREFRPVDTMVDTAAAIAGGDLSLRVPDGDPKTELGRLGSALNDMLGQIEEGLKQRDVNESRLRRFVADAAHELRTPLTSVRGYSELYRQGAYPDQASVDHAMSRIESEGSRMARLVDDLLLLARMDQQRPLEQRPMDLVSLANEAATDFETVAPDYPLEWSPDGELVVRGDRIRIRQIIDNLLSNARMHTPKGTTIRMAVRRDGANAEILIADEGPGISSEDRERIFERFWRADSSRTRNTGGSGLGLAIVQSLVLAHGGTVRLESEPGKGARFTIRLPLLAPH